jgi:hypothetical protein
MYAKILAAGKQKQQGQEILAASCNAANFSTRTHAFNTAGGNHLGAP